MLQGKGKEVAPNLPCLSPQRDFSPCCQVGCWVSVGRTRLAAQQHVPELSPPSHAFPRSWEKDIYPLSEQKAAPLPGEGIPAQIPVCKGILALSCPDRLQRLGHLSPSAQERKGLTDPPSLPPLPQPCTPRLQKPSTEMPLLRKKKQQQEC